MYLIKHEVEFCLHQAQPISLPSTLPDIFNMNSCLITFLVLLVLCAHKSLLNPTDAKPLPIGPPFSGKCACACYRPTKENKRLVRRQCRRKRKMCKKTNCFPGVAPPPGTIPVFDITCCESAIFFP